MNITKIEYNSYKSGGLCDTCDYGANYINDISITWDDNIKIKFYAETDYEVMSEADWMIILANAKNRDDIKKAWAHKYSKYINENNSNIVMIETKIKQ